MMMFKSRAKQRQALVFAACILLETGHSTLFMQNCILIHGAQQQETEHRSMMRHSHLSENSFRPHLLDMMQNITAHLYSTSTKAVSNTTSHATTPGSPAFLESPPDGPAGVIGSESAWP